MEITTHLNKENEMHSRIDKIPFWTGSQILSLRDGARNLESVSNSVSW